MVTSCEIEFTGNPLKVVFSGQKVNGRVSIVVDEPENIKSESASLKILESIFKSNFRNRTSNSRLRSCVF